MMNSAPPFTPNALNMTPEQALATLAAICNAPVTKLALSVTDLAAFQTAIQTLAVVVAPKPENVTPIPKP